MSRGGWHHCSRSSRPRADEERGLDASQVEEYHRSRNLLEALVAARHTGNTAS